MLSLLADALMIATRQEPFHREPPVRHEHRWPEFTGTTPRVKAR